VSAEYPQNDYLMRVLMRVVAFAKERIADVVPQLVDSLTIILKAVSAPLVVAAMAGVRAPTPVLTSARAGVRQPHQPYIHALPV